MTLMFFFFFLPDLPPQHFPSVSVEKLIFLLISFGNKMMSMYRYKNQYFKHAISNTTMCRQAYQVLHWRCKIILTWTFWYLLPKSFIDLTLTTGAVPVQRLFIENPSLSSLEICCSFEIIYITVWKKKNKKTTGLVKKS